MIQWLMDHSTFAMNRYSISVVIGSIMVQDREGVIR